jgi:hypothetical protein
LRGEAHSTAQDFNASQREIPAFFKFLAADVKPCLLKGTLHATDLQEWIDFRAKALAGLREARTNLAKGARKQSRDSLLIETELSKSSVERLLTLARGFFTDVALGRAFEFGFRDGLTGTAECPGASSLLAEFNAPTGSAFFNVADRGVEDRLCIGRHVLFDVDVRKALG